MTERQSQSGIMRVVPVLSAGCVWVLAASTLILYHTYGESEVARLQPLPGTYTPSLQEQELQRRFLRDIIDKGPDINDDITRDETCKQYMSKFLNAQCLSSC
jgi:hypothetical protein